MAGLSVRKINYFVLFDRRLPLADRLLAHLLAMFYLLVLLASALVVIPLVVMLFLVLYWMLRVLFTGH